MLPGVCGKYSFYFILENQLFINSEGMFDCSLVSVFEPLGLSVETVLRTWILDTVSCLLMRDHVSMQGFRSCEVKKEFKKKMIMRKLNLLTLGKKVEKNKTLSVRRGDGKIRRPD